MDFYKNKFYKSQSTKIAGNKVLPKSNPFEISRKFINQTQKTVEQQPMTPEKRLEEQKNERHFFHQDPFQK